MAAAGKCLTRLLDASPSAAERVVGVVAERAQGGVPWLVKVCCDVPLLGAAKAWGNWVHKATTTHPRLPRFWSSKKQKGGSEPTSVQSASRQEAKVCALWQGKAKKDRQSQTKENKQTQDFLHMSARALGPHALHAPRRFVVCLLGR